VILRQPILYAEAMWRKQRTSVLLLALLGIGFSGFMLYSRHFQFDLSVLIWLGYVPIALLFGGLLLYYRWRNHVEVTDRGLKVSNLLSSMVIDYDLLRSPRVQPLDRHFQDARKRYIRPINKPLMNQPALFVRLRGDDAQVAQVRRKLGSQLTSEDTIALPIPDPDAMAWELSARLPEPTGTNRGGQRRRKRAR
jgi:hypothetical protein